MKNTWNENYFSASVKVKSPENIVSTRFTPKDRNTSAEPVTRADLVALCDE